MRCYFGVMAGLMKVESLSESVLVLMIVIHQTKKAQTKDESISSKLEEVDAIYEIPSYVP